MKAKGRFTDSRKLRAFSLRAVRRSPARLASSRRRIARQQARGSK